MSIAKVIVPGVVVAALFFAAWSLRQDDAPQLADTAWGNVDARHVSLAFEGAGRILELIPEEGTRVRKGDLLGRLDTEALQIERRRAEASLRALEAQADMAAEGYRAEDIEVAEKNVESLAAQLSSAERTYARQKQLFEAKATSRQNLDDARYAAETLRRELQAAEATRSAYQAGLRPQEVAAARAQADAAKAAVDALDYKINQAAIIRAPIDGIVRTRLAEPGDMASPSRTIFQLSVTSPKWIRAYVTERQLALLREGDTATVITDTTPALQATIAAISDTAEFTPKTVQTEDLRTVLVYEVKLTLPDPDNRLRLGQPVTVRFNGGSGSNLAESQHPESNNSANSGVKNKLSAESVR